MSVADQDLGEVTRHGDTVTIIFRRRYAKPIKKIWAALTVPERLADWFCEVDIEALRPGARIELYFREPDVRAVGHISIYEPMRTMAWTWPQPGGSETFVRFDVEPDGAGGCTLTLTESGLPAKDGAGNTFGWHAHLEAFEDAVDGKRTPWSTLLEREKRIRPLYEGRLPV